ncbi:acyltransferase family protein [Hyunsoonleella sp. 2307UL5-6]|uniref:acyltransferase family protein n=1 Tax=Hyunsoonleella sp. 2307UL5-6 TaxID=3384768 RepID=UPI0039BC6AB4
MKKERILYIDRLRGINILLVVMGHVITGNVINGESSEILVYGSTFRMPLFMFLCGYIASKVMKPKKIFDNYGAFVLKKCRTLLVPFFVWPLLVNPFFFSDSLSFNFYETLLELINGGGLWFLWQLFFVTLLYSLWLFLSSTFNTNKNLIKDVLFLLLIAVGLLAIWQLNIVVFMRNFMLFFVFYFLGVIVAKYDVLSKLIMNKIVFSLAFLVFCLVVGHYQYGMSSLNNSVIKFTCAISAIIVFYTLIRRATFNEFIDKNIRKFGVNSLVIYVTHYYVVYVFATPFISAEFNQIPLFLICSLLSVMVALISIFIYRILNFSNILGLILYGNKFQK